MWLRTATFDSMCVSVFRHVCEASQKWLATADAIEIIVITLHCRNFHICTIQK